MTRCFLCPAHTTEPLDCPSPDKGVNHAAEPQPAHQVSSQSLLDCFHLISTTAMQILEGRSIGCLLPEYPMQQNTSKFSGCKLSVFAKSLNLRMAVQADIFEQFFQVQLGWLTVSSFKVQLNSSGLSRGWVLTLAEIALDLSGCCLVLSAPCAARPPNLEPSDHKREEEKVETLGCYFLSPGLCHICPLVKARDKEGMGFITPLIYMFMSEITYKTNVKLPLSLAKNMCDLTTVLLTLNTTYQLLLTSWLYSDVITWVVSNHLPHWNECVIQLACG